MNTDPRGVELPPLGEKPAYITKQYRHYSGSRAAVDKNLEYLVDPRRVYDGTKFEKEIEENWMNYDESAFGNFLAHFDHEFGKHFMRHAAMGPPPVEYNPDSKNGCGWAFHGISTRADFHNHSRAADWLTLFASCGPFFGWIENYTMSPKTEMTDVESINADKCRVFYMAGPMTDAVGKLYMGRFNQALKECHWNRAGWVLQYGGVTEMMDEMKRFLRTHPDYVFTPLDLRKFDITRAEFFFRQEVTTRLLYPTLGLPHFSAVIQWLFKGALHKYLMWPGIREPLVTANANPSGWPGTTEGNCYDNFYSLWYHCCWKNNMTWDEFLKCYWNLLSDDVNNLMPRRVVVEKGIAISYAELGRVFKGFECDPGRDPEGQVFCGIHLHRDGRFEISPDKCFFSADDMRGLGNAARVNKLESLATNLVGNPQMFADFVKYVSPLTKALRITLSEERCKLIQMGLMPTLTLF